MTERIYDMKIAVVEPLAIEKKEFMKIARKAVGDDVDIVYWDTRTEAVSYTHLDVYKRQYHKFLKTIKLYFDCF